MKAKLDVNFEANYHIELVEASTGDVKQAADFHNIPVAGLSSCLAAASQLSVPAGGSESSYTGTFMIVNTLRVGSGSTAPTRNDTALAEQLWSMQYASKKFEWADDYTGRVTATYVFPATSAYVGTIREVGLACMGGSMSGGSWFERHDALLCTRALITDSEGQPISFEKTDLDILTVTVTVEMSLSSSSASFKIFKHCSYIRHILYGLSNDYYGSHGTFSGTHGQINVCRFEADIERHYAKNAGPENIDQAIATYGMLPRTRDANGAHIEYPVKRLLATTVTSERYYKAVAIPGIGYWKMPNEDVLPTYTISSIAIGTGDGETTQFTNPLCYFKEETDIVYKNGVALTRGVDYEIYNIGNRNCLPEVTDILGIPKVTSAAVSNTTLEQRPLFIPTTLYGTPSKLAEYFGDEIAWCFSGSNPLYLEYDEAVTMNCLKCTGGLRSMSGTNGYNNIAVGTMFYLDASEDGITYNEVGSATLATSNGPFEIEFTNTTAKYWRLRTSHNGLVSIYSSNPDYYMTLNRKEPYVTFTEPPANGDVLTMDVGMDIIMKNSNFVIDTGCTLDITF